MQLPAPQEAVFRPGYFICLIGLIITLPLFEAPKTIFLLAFYAAAPFACWQERQKITWRGDDWLLLSWMFSGFVVAAFAGLHHKEWGGANGPLMLGLLVLFLKHMHFNKTQVHCILLTILLSTLLANIEGLWQLYSGKQKALELHSVGHVNHSAIYLCLNFGLALSMTLNLRSNASTPLKAFVVACLALTAVSIILTNSRATIATMGLMTLTFTAVWIKQSRLPLLIAVLSITFAAGALYVGHARVIQKHRIHTSQSFLGERKPIWSSALLIWRHNPVFGIGIKNYGEADPSIQQQWLEQEGQNYNNGNYLAYAHGHSFYLTTLAEQGAFGLGLTMLVLLRIIWLLYRYRPRVEHSDAYWILWLAAFGAIQVVLVNGIFNTTFHHEHGLFAGLLIGLWWQQVAKQHTAHSIPPV